MLPKSTCKLRAQIVHNACVYPSRWWGRWTGWGRPVEVLKADPLIGVLLLLLLVVVLGCVWLTTAQLLLRVFNLLGITTQLLV